MEEKEIHREELVIPGAPYPISNSEILGQSHASGSAAIVPSSPSSSSSSSSSSYPSKYHVDSDSHVGDTDPPAGVTLAVNLAGDQSGSSSIISKHPNCCSTDIDTTITAGDAVTSQQEQEPLLQPPQDAAGSSAGLHLQIRTPPLGLIDAQQDQTVQVSVCQSRKQACQSGDHPGPGPLSLGEGLGECLLVPQHPQQPQLSQDRIIPPQDAQARLTPHKQAKEQFELPTFVPPSYINSPAPSQLSGSREEPRRLEGSSEKPLEEAGGDTNTHHNPSELASQTSTPPPNMMFSDLYKSPRSPFNKLRHSIPSVTLPATDLEADLISRDKTRQKEAVKKFLSEKIRCDWEFTWPPTPAPAPAPATTTHTDEKPESSSIPPQDGGETGAKLEAACPSGDSSSSVPAASPVFDEDAPRDPGEEADSESDAESAYSTVSEDQLHFHPRIEWTSDISDDEIPAHTSSPFRFDTPDAVGTAVQMSINERKARRRRAVREEISWNTGLACFEARRDAWTGAKTVRVKPKPATPISPSSTRRLSFWRHHRSESTASQNGPLSPGSPPISSPLSPTSTHTSQQASLAQTASETESSNASKIHSTASRDHALYPVETLIPVPPPLLPPQNPMRASVTPSIYPSLYDKIVVHSLQPSCPVNLGDMLRACVVGWKRDGEWPPKSTIQVVPMPSAAEMMALRQQRKAAQAREKHARKASTATNGTSRRLSFVGFLGGGSKHAEKDKAQQQHEEAAGKETHSDDAKSGGSGKGIRRSLQKVFSFGQHGSHGGHEHHAAHTAAHAEGAAISPTKEVTAAG